MEFNFRSSYNQDVVESEKQGVCEIQRNVVENLYVKALFSVRM